MLISLRDIEEGGKVQQGISVEFVFVPILSKSALKPVRGCCDICSRVVLLIGVCTY